MPLIGERYRYTDETGSFTWDAAGYGTDETDISALFTTALTGTTRRRYSVFVDLTDLVTKAGWGTCTIRVKVKIDASNYRTVDKKAVAIADAAAAEEPGVPFDIPAVALDVQITMTFDVAVASDATVYYHTVTAELW